MLPRFALRLEGALGSMLSTDQRTVQHYGLALQGSARVGFNVVDALSIQLTWSNWYFPSDRIDGQAMLLGGGLRLEPRVGTLGRLFVDADVGAGLTGSFTRLMFDLGVGFEFAATRWLGVGPYVRYGQVMAAGGDVPSDALFIAGGVSVALRVPEGERREQPVVVAPPPPPPVRVTDRDHDGVDDAADACPDTPGGEHPDPRRPGCPVGDQDHDGVLDDADQCVDTPAGEHPDPARAGCPDGDDDGDHVLNHDDACPTQPPGPRPDPNRAGCPIPDRDNDTIPDATDHCPDQPGAPSMDPTRNGCPGLVRVSPGQISILQPVFFSTNGAHIQARSFPVLLGVADAMRALPQIHRVLIGGHTDDVGPDRRNLLLSDQRAAAVLRYLVAHGVEASRLEAHGFGETDPIASNRTPEGRATNRRVEFRIIDPAPEGSE